MPEPKAFRRGCDLGEETCADDEDTVTCVDCGAVESDQRAYEGGWQFAPAVCPSCLRWEVVEGERCCFEVTS